MDTTRVFSEAVKIWLALGGVGLVVAWRWLPRLWAHNLLLVLTLVAGVNYARYTPDILLRQVDAYDLIHYYLGAKYFDELGYYDLYPAALVVDHEHGAYSPKSTFYRAQDAERGYRENVSIREGIEHGKKVRDEKFTPERWKEFEHDFLVLQRNHQLGRKLWFELINDRGFNGTPAWLFVARPIAKLWPVEWIKALCYIDFLLLTLALLAVAWAFGWVTSIWCLFFLFVTYSLRWPYVTWAFLRYDWVSALLLSMALLKKSRWVPAGVLTAYAALVRFFPAVWMFGPFMKGVMGLLAKRKNVGAALGKDGGVVTVPGGSVPEPSTGPVPFKDRLDRRMLLMAAGFVGAAILLEGGAIVSFGMEAVKTHAGNIAEHIKPEELSSRRVGFALGYAYNGRADPKWLPDARKIQIKEEAPQRLFWAALILGAIGFALRRRRPEEAFAIGFIPFFLLSTASYYYYVCRLTLIAWHASDLGKVRNRVGLAWLLGIEFLCNLAETVAPGYRVMLVGHMAWALLLYAIGLAIALNYEGGLELDAPEEPPDTRPIVDGEVDWRGEAEVEETAAEPAVAAASDDERAPSEAERASAARQKRQQGGKKGKKKR